MGFNSAFKGLRHIGEQEYRLKVVLTSVLDGGKQSASCSGQFTSRNRKLAEPHRLSERFRKLKCFFPLRGIELRFLCRPARILLSIPTQGGPGQLSRYSCSLGAGWSALIPADCKELKVLHQRNANIQGLCNVASQHEFNKSLQTIRPFLRRTIISQGIKPPNCRTSPFRLSSAYSIYLQLPSAFSNEILRKCHAICQQAQSFRKHTYRRTSLVVQWSGSLTTNHEVPGSIPGSTMGIFPCRERFPW